LLKNIRIAVKYCGGCNPYYERREAVREIESRIKTKLEIYNIENIPDIVLIVCGCKSQCIDINAYKSKIKTIVLNDIKGMDEVVNTISKLSYI